MTRYLVTCLAAMALVPANMVPAEAAKVSRQRVAPSEPTKVAMDERVRMLKRSYPDLIYSIKRNSIRLMSNRFVTIDDGVKKGYFAKRRDGDLEDQLSDIYPLGRCYKGRRKRFDPGAVRSFDFFRGAYGSTEHYVKRETETIDWFGTPIRFSKRHGATRALRRVLAELRALPAKFHDVLKSPRRTIDWSPIADTDRLSVHAYAIAIDLNPAFADNWRGGKRGSKRNRLSRYKNRIYPRVIAIFEKHGFIWGGKWHRFETGHFEYRPAMIAIAKLAEQRGCEKK